MSKGTEVILVTADPRLREMVRHHQPRGVSLRCVLPGEASQEESVDPAELWVDLDTPAAVDLAASRAAGTETGHHIQRRVYFHSQNSLSVKGLPPGLFIRKPCGSTVLRVLWSGVSDRAGETSRAYSKPGCSGLPEWVMEFHELGLRELCRKCVSGLPHRLGYADVSLYLYDQDEGLLTLAETSHKRPIDLAVRMADNQSHLMVIAARSGRPIKTTDVQRERQRLGLPPVQDGRPYPDGSCLVAPLASGGRLWGVLNLSGAARKPDGEPDVPLETLFAFIGRALRYACAYDRARTEARVDPLTGLYNHRWMMETLAREIRRSQRFSTPLALIVVDLDDLKAVNDQHGHPAGDSLLRHVASRVTKALRQFDSAARVGGDEFIVLLPATDLEGARQVARRIIAAIRSEAAVHRGVALSIRASLGVAQHHSGWGAAQLVEAADRAMYMAKRQGRDQIACWPHEATVVRFAGDAMLGTAPSPEHRGQTMPSQGPDTHGTHKAKRDCPQPTSGWRAAADHG